MTLTPLISYSKLEFCDNSSSTFENWSPVLCFRISDIEAKSKFEAVLLVRILSALVLAMQPVTCTLAWGALLAASSIWRIASSTQRLRTEQPE